jgi:metal-responsive CopG/Arc/MetJ family transcriptional regulator
MKTAVSIPDEIFAEAEQLARALETTRSQLYSRALREFVARNAPGRVTAAMNQTLDKIGPEDGSARRTAARKVFERVEW